MIDVTLVRRCQNRESDAFEELYKAYSTKALRTACLLTGRRDIAEEAMQEALFQCYRDISKLRDPERFNIWFNRILVRICRDASLKEKKQKSENLEEDDMERLQDDYNISEDIEKRQENIILMNAINNLKLPLRITVILFYYNDMSIKEIAHVMGCFEGTVKSRLYYAKKTLEKELKKADAENYFENRQILGKEG